MSSATFPLAYVKAFVLFTPLHAPATLLPVDPFACVLHPVRTVEEPKAYSPVDGMTSAHRPHVSRNGEQQQATTSSIELAMPEWLHPCFQSERGARPISARKKTQPPPVNARLLSSIATDPTFDSGATSQHILYHPAFGRKGGVGYMRCDTLR